MNSVNTPCELCSHDGGELLYQGTQYRVVLVDDAQYPGFCRVIWHQHVKEMTDLPLADRSALMAAVWEIEAAIREVMQPAKINLASLGNMTPHLHWHVIPRYADDAHFPDPVWAAAKRISSNLESRTAWLPALREAIVRRMQ